MDLPKFATACRIRGGGSVGRNGFGVRGSFLKWCRGGIRYSDFYQLGVGQGAGRVIKWNSDEGSEGNESLDFLPDE